MLWYQNILILLLHLSCLSLLWTVMLFPESNTWVTYFLLCNFCYWITCFLIWSPRLWPTRVHRFQEFVLVVIIWLFQFVLIDFSESFPLVLFLRSGPQTDLLKDVLALETTGDRTSIPTLSGQPAVPPQSFTTTTKKRHKILPFSPINVRNIRENNPHPLIYLNTFVLGCSNVLSSYRGDHNIICSHHVEYNVLDEKTKHVSTWLKCLKLKNQLTSNASITL